MNAAFDTHQVFKNLQASGLSESEAEAITNALRQAREFDLGQLATKADLKAAISDLRSELLKYMIGQTFVILGAVAALLRWIH